ncbi:hypothetical protein [Spirillospora sp. CA-128828]|uniref:hypothetical protein n=1 Tax=Spirillospora sp. CA-128828 TaxID=3240033 RepID=UPI003D8F9200
MSTEQFRELWELWEQANRSAHARIMAIVKGESETVSAQDGVVTLNLLPIINDVLVTVSRELPTLFGKQLDLPAVTSGRIPPDLQAKVQQALGVTLPADFGQITIYHHSDLTGFQDMVLAFKKGPALLVAGTLMCLVLALVVSPGRRRTVLQFGVATAVSATVLSAGMRAVQNRLLEHIPEGVYRQGASVAVDEIFSSLRTHGDRLLWSDTPCRWMSSGLGLGVM